MVFLYIVLNRIEVSPGQIAEGPADGLSNEEVTVRQVGLDAIE